MSPISSSSAPPLLMDCPVCGAALEPGKGPAHDAWHTLLRARLGALGLTVDKL